MLTIVGRTEGGGTIVGRTEGGGTIVGGVFRFYETHGLPLDVLRERGATPDWRAFRTPSAPNRPAPSTSYYLFTDTAYVFSHEETRENSTTMRVRDDAAESWCKLLNFKGP